MIIAETLRQMLADLGHKCEIAVDNQKDGLEMIKVKSFDLAILDINLEGEHEGIVLGAECERLNIPFLFLTSYSDYETINAAKQVKPGAYLIKPFTPNDILVAIEMTMMHQASKGKNNLDNVISRLDLSGRETEVIQCLIDRLSNSEIADKLFVSTNTVKFHIKNLYSKLGVASRSEVLERLRLMAGES